MYHLQIRCSCGKSKLFLRRVAEVQRCTMCGKSWLQTLKDGGAQCGDASAPEALAQGPDVYEMQRRTTAGACGRARFGAIAALHRQTAKTSSTASSLKSASRLCLFVAAPQNIIGTLNPKP